MKSRRSQVIQKRLVKSILWLIITPFLLLGLVILLIHVPPIQNAISTRLTDYLTEGTGYRTEIDYVNIRWFNSITMDGTRIYDENDVVMIGVDEMALSFDLTSLLGKRDIETQEAWVYRADVNLRYIDEEKGLNIDDWSQKITELTASGDSTSNSGGFLLNEIELIDSKFSISDYRKDSIQNGFDYNHFQLVNINADLLNLKADADSFLLDVKYLTAEDLQSGMTVDEMSTYFRYSGKGMHFLDLRLKTGKSLINHRISFMYDSTSQMSEFTDQVEIVANLQESFIHTDDLSYFAPELEQYNTGVGISGRYQGMVSAFYGRDFVITLGDGTEFRGEMDIEGLPDIDNAFFDISFVRSSFEPYDVIDLVSKRNYAVIENLGHSEFTGQFDGFLNDFVADVAIRTAIGDIDANVQINLTGNLPYYDGFLSLSDFDLGRYMEDPLYQKIDLAGSINGNGFRLEDAQFNLIADIERFGINGYDIKRIETDGAIAQSFFSGQLSISDPNLNLFANGSVDLRDDAWIFKVVGELTNASLDSLNLINEPLNLSSNFDIDVKGAKIDSLKGEVKLLNTSINFRQKDLVFDSLLLNSTKDAEGRVLDFYSEHLDVKITGDFLFTQLLKEFNDYQYQYGAFFTGEIQEAKRFSKDEGNSDDHFQLNYDVDLKNIDPILNLLDTTISVADNSWIKGNFRSENNESFSIQLYSPKLIYGTTEFMETDIAFDGDQISSPENLSVIGYVFSTEQAYGSSTKTQNLTVEAVWDGTHIDLRNSVAQVSSDNYAELGADIDFFEERIELKFEDSNIIAYEESWNFANNNKVTFTKEKIVIDSLNISNMDQSLGFNGAIAIEKDSLETMTVNFNQLEVKNINAVTAQTYEGLLNGELIAQNLLFDPLFFGNLTVDELNINDFLVGDIAGSLNWNDPLKKLEVEFGVNRNDNDIILLDGGIYPRSTEQLDLQLHLNSSNLAIAEPYISDYFTEIDGFITGDFNIIGQLNAPALSGNGQISDGQIKINYLNTLYAFDGALNIEKDLIELENFLFEDVQNQQADFNGRITHDNYKDFKLDLVGDLRSFQVMNLPTDLKADFYGQAYATGQVNIVGEASNLTISADARTEANSRVFIPIIKESEEVITADYIQFIDRTDTTENSEASKLELSDVEQLKIEGLNLDLNIEVTPDAYAEIIIDPRTGDIIRGRGNGQLRLVIDSDGDFQMTGGLDIEEGAYNFSLYSIINKEFKIEQPSSITWYGDPYTGVLSIKAAYNESTPITPILEQAGFGNAEEGASDLGRRVPVKVLLDLQGPLLSPEISFDIDFGEVQAQDYETITSINAFKNRIQTDEQELNRQVLSLILLGKFSDQGNVNIVGGAASQSVSQLLSNQLSQLVAQLDENLEIDFDLRDLSDEAFNTMRLRLSYTFLEGRLRVTREGGLANYEDVSSAVGDWTAEYLLTPDGRYRVKIYYRSNYDYTAGAISQSGTFSTQGASITQTSSFNSFKELFQKIEKSRDDSQKTTQSQKSSDTSN